MKTVSALLLTILLVALLPGMCLAVEVTDAVICRDVQDRQPVEPADSFPADISKVYCWSKIADGQGTTIKHVYYYGDQEKASVELQIRSPLFRTYSSKRMLPIWTGQWTVDIVDAEGTVLKTVEFTIGEEPEPEPEPEPEEEAPSEAPEAPEESETVE